MINEFLEKNKQNMIDDLTKLVSYNSVYSEDALPFGKTNQAVLAEALGLFEREGLKTTNLDNYCGFGEVGEGKELIGILAHLDVVPAGEGWSSDPFVVRNDGEYLYGRGVTDDKGPVIASLYALKYLIETKYPFKKRVRLIVGCNEETGSKCIEHYVEKEGHIDMGFTPDGNFPGIFAEKGVLRGTISATNSKIINIYGGDAENVVCKKIVVELPVGSYDESTLNEFFRDNNIEYNLIKTDRSITMTVFGKAAHASTPEQGINAMSYLMEGLYRADFDDELVTFYHNRIALTHHGELFKANQFDDEYTDLTLNVGVISKAQNVITLTVDVRFPVKAEPEAVKELFMKALNMGNVRFEISELAHPLFFDVNIPMIQAMLKAYKDVTGEKDAEMEAIGGGTYAKAIHNCIAFGCEFPGENCHIHDADESLNIANFLKQVHIYIEAIKNLNEA